MNEAPTYHEITITETNSYRLRLPDNGTGSYREIAKRAHDLFESLGPTQKASILMRSGQRHFYVKEDGDRNPITFDENEIHDWRADATGVPA